MHLLPSVGKIIDCLDLICSSQAEMHELGNANVFSENVRILQSRAYGIIEAVEQYHAEATAALTAEHLAELKGEMVACKKLRVRRPRKRTSYSLPRFVNLGVSGSGQNQ